MDRQDVSWILQVGDACIKQAFQNNAKELSFLANQLQLEISSRRGDDCRYSNSKVRAKSRKGRYCPPVVISWKRSREWPHWFLTFNTLHLCQIWGWAPKTLENISNISATSHSLFLQFCLLSSQTSTVNVSGEELKPSTAHLHPHSKSLKVDHCSQPLLICSLPSSSLCLSLLDLGNSKPCTKSKIQSAQIDLSNISFQQSLNQRLDPESLRSYCSSWPGIVYIEGIILPWH